MEQIQLTSHIRTGRGKGAARQLRRQGLIPAVVYGGTHGNLALSVSSHDLRHIIAKGGGEHSLITLEINDEKGSQQIPVIIKDYQLDPAMRTLLHADFLEVTMGQAIEIHVPLTLTGSAPGVKAGGILEFSTREIAVECLPTKMLDHIDVDISSLEIGDSIMVRDIELSGDYKIITNLEATILSVAAPLTEKEEELGEEKPTEPEVIQKGKKEEE